MFICEVDTDDGSAAVLNFISLSSYFGCICKICALDPPKVFLVAIDDEDDEGNGGIIRDVNPFLSFPLLLLSSLLNNHLAFSMRH